MKLEINEVYHQYILKVVIFALFAYKRQIRHPNVYKQSVYNFVEKRLPWKINLVIDTGDKLSKEEERDLILEELLNDKKVNFLKYISIIFTTPLKHDCMIEVDLTDEKKYEHFIYS